MHMHTGTITEVIDFSFSRQLVWFFLLYTEHEMLLQIAVLRLVKDAQLQHGLRHDDYQRYRYVVDTSKAHNYITLYDLLNTKISKHRTFMLL